MPYALPPMLRETSCPYVVFDKLFTPEECQKIIELSKILESKSAQIGDGHGGSVNLEKRRTEVFWLHWNSEMEWIFSRLAQAIASANAKWWQFHLSGMNEPLQLTHYRGEDEGFYDWHEDCGESGSFSQRKISAVILLNEGFQGGSFEIFGIGKPKEMTPGTLILFPSYKTHRVAPVTQGDRWSLVTWISGPPFV